MSRSSRFSITLILAATLPLSAADEPTKSVAVDDSMVHVLKSDWFDLAEQLGDTSEAGQDLAARLLAAARRIQTEARISTKSMQRVLVLDGWREALNRWDDLELEIVSLQSGGGTMWSHMMQRNDAETEEFLDSIADHLPLEGAELKPETSRAIDDLLNGAKKRLALAKADAGKAGLKSEHQATDLARRLGEARERLKWQFRLAGDADATKRLIARYREATSAWESVNNSDKK